MNKNMMEQFVDDWMPKGDTLGWWICLRIYGSRGEYLFTKPVKRLFRG